MPRNQNLTTLNNQNDLLKKRIERLRMTVQRLQKLKMISAKKGNCKIRIKKNDTTSRIILPDEEDEEMKIKRKRKIKMRMRILKRIVG